MQRSTTLIHSRKCSVYKSLRSHSTKQEDITKLPSDVHRLLLNQIISDLRFRNKEDFYQITNKEIEKRGGKELTQHYKTPFTLISSFYPDYDWLPWKFDKCPNNYWENINNQKKFMEWAGNQFKIKDMSDWYKITRKDFEDIGGHTLLAMYNTSPSLLLATIYPEYEWLPWKFEAAPKHYWELSENRRKFMDWAGKQLGIKEMNDWYKVSQKDFRSLGGGGLLGTYNGSPSQLITSVYSEYNWLPWKFSLFSKNNWNQENQKKFVEWAGKELGIKDLSDWYKVTTNDIVSLGGSSLLEVHNKSLHQLLSNVYKNFAFDMHKFTDNSWNMMLDSDESKKQFVTSIESQLKIKNENDWNSLSKEQLQGIKLPPNWKLSNLLSLVKEVYKSPNSKSNALSNRKSQYLLKSMLSTMFPNEVVLEEYRHPDIVTKGGQFFELDYFYPKFQLAIEYQGQQHYNNSMKFLHNISSFEERKQLDQEKNQLCKEKGITLIEVPYWWDRKYESLAVTIYSQRSDLFRNKPMGTPIPTTKPTTSAVINGFSNSPIFSNKKVEKPKKYFMLAKNYETGMDPTGWLMSEKYDGMRLYWTGTEFYTRQGKPVKIPEYWRLQLPRFALDGELWTQYGLYQDAVSLCGISGDKEERWKNAVFWVFDAPNMNENILEERIEFLKKQNLPTFVKVVEFVKCTGKEHLKQYFDSIIAKGGEGVMLRDPQSLYKAGRSESMRKFKPFQDTEVKVVENNYPHGLQCEQKNGIRIFVGLNESNYEEAKRVKEGDVVTVKHLGANVYGTLQYPKFYRVRTDVQWDAIKSTK